MTLIPDGGHAEVEWGARFSGMELPERFYNYREAQESARSHVAAGSEVPGRVATLVAREVTYGPWVTIAEPGQPPVSEAASAVRCDPLQPGHMLLSTVDCSNMSALQRAAYVRDIPRGCLCDYLWTGLVWTRSGAEAECPQHGGERS